MRKQKLRSTTAPPEHQIFAAAQRLHRTQCEWRRHLHRYPEISNQEFKTTLFLRQRLRQAGLRLLPLKLPTGVLAEIRGNLPGRTVVIRSDIDALPIPEKSGVPFASQNHGVMHACGHDIHMSVVLGAATLLAGRRKQLQGTVRFIFQPAEEMPPGGARPMIAQGALKNVDLVLGLHNDPHLPTGKIGLRSGPLMASVFDFDLVIRGVAGHAARPHLSVDAISVAAEVIESLQKVVSRESDPMDPVAVSFGQIQGGTARNVVAETVSVVGTARALTRRAQRCLPKLIARTAGGICRARGARYELIERAAYPVLANDPAVIRHLERTSDKLFGPGHPADIEPVLGGEDFACYLEKVRGAMFWLGVGNRKIKADKPWHSPQFVADETAMPYGTALLVGATLEFLESGLE